MPTFAEFYPGLTVMSWHGIWAPSGVPTAIVNRLHTAFVEVTRDPEMQKRIKDLNVEPLGISRSEMAALVRRDADIFSKIAKAKNITLD